MKTLGLGCALTLGALLGRGEEIYNKAHLAELQKHDFAWFNRWYEIDERGRGDV